MKLYSQTLTAIAIFICFISLSSCKKTNNSTGNNSGGSDTTDIPFITPLGDTAGTPVSGTIGSGGGTLTSSDGRVQLVVPSGALSKTTTITIQPIVNLCPGGVGLAYDLLPNGIRFAVPASLVYNYTDSEVNGTDPFLVTSAFQDSAGAWEINDTEKDVDTVNRKISFDINHFTPYNFVPEIEVVPKPLDLMENQTSLVKVQVWIVPVAGTYNGGKYIRGKSDIANSLVSNWQVHNYNASGADGTITGNGSSAVYLAPSSIDKNKYVEVSCDINIPVTVKLKKGKTKVYTSINKGNLIGLISGNFSYDVSITAVVHQSSFYIPDTYTDGASMQVDIKYKDVTVSNIKNRVPNATPAQGSFGDATVTFMPDPIGIVNIISATGQATSDPYGGGELVDITLNQSGTIYPMWVVQDNHDSGHETRGGYPIAGVPPSFQFTGTNQTHTSYSSVNIGLDTLYVTVTPRH